MVVRLRLSRLGCKNRPFFRVMAADSRSPRDGKHIEVLGYFNPLPGESSEFIPFDCSSALVLTRSLSVCRPGR
ncbi:hypothetical protein HID58_038469 [Brassica napus]|uniref:30S ribosomal protein S16 n=1 Tax=Brassica napus TaxID=3708 RepID=A0ABQ8BPB1_BRANA|nr:hypothetical protein HID58_038469 [Brassica napus]